MGRAFKGKKGRTQLFRAGARKCSLNGKKKRAKKRLNDLQSLQKSMDGFRRTKKGSPKKI